MQSRKDAEEEEKELLKLLREKMCGCVLNARQLWKVRTTVLPSESLSLICICPLSFRKDEKKKEGDGCGGGGGRGRAGSADAVDAADVHGHRKLGE